MADRLTELLAQNAGLGDEEAALQLQMLRAKTLRDRAAVDPRRTTGKGGMFSALARGVNAYRGGTMEAEADTTRAGLDARRMELRQAAQESVGGLPSLSGGYDQQTGTPLPPPEEALAAHRALGRALGFAPDKGLVAQGASVSEGATKAQEAADKRAQEAMIKMVTLDNGERVPVASLKLAWDAFKGGSSQQGGHQTLLLPDAETLAKDAEAKKGGGSSRDIVTLTGAGGEMFRYNKVTREIEPILAPEGSPGQAAPGEKIPFVKGAPGDVAKLSADTAYVKQMPEDLALLKKYVGKNALGVGILEGLPPNFATSAEGIALRQAGTRITNALLYLNSGKAINEAEVQRILEGLGTGRFDDQDAFNSGVVALDRYVKRAARDFVASRPPAVVALAKQQGVLDALAPWLSGVKGFETPPPPPKKSNLPGATKAPIGAAPSDAKERQKWIQQKRSEGYSRDEIAKAMGG